MMSTLDQQRAAFAWQSVTGCTRDYVILAKGAGALIMSNGLMATLAFYEGKAKSHHLELSKHIREWLVKQQKVPGQDFAVVMKSLYESESPQYRAATQEALDLLRWIRQFAAAVNR